jgi:hypothetical protein
MDSPILPGRAGDEESREQERYFRWGTKLRFLAAAVALIAALLGLVSRLEASNSSQPPLNAPLSPGQDGWVVPTTIPPVYGDPTPAAMLPAAKSSGQQRSVCKEEIRPLPTQGAWVCRSWVPLDTREIGRRATDTGGPCTHRVVSDAGGTWNCWMRIAIPSVALHMPYSVPLMFGHLIAAPGKTSPQVCREESRTSETEGPWTCVGSQDEPAGWRIAEPVDPGGPCSYRVADEMTGVWSCQSADAQDAGAS